MSQPTTYDRQTSFALYSAENPGEPHSGIDVDAEFNAVKVTLDETLANLALIQDDDGALARGSVGRVQFAANVEVGFDPPTVWAASTVYTASVSTVHYGTKFYSCIETHTSGVSFDASKWDEIAELAVQALELDSVGTDELKTGAVTTVKLGSQAVTTAKLADANVTTVKLADLNVTLAKLAAAVQQCLPTTGDVKLTLKTTADAGWVMFDDGTIGDASSTATTRANADCEALFTLIYTNISDTYAPVTGGRGASAAADWAAHKKIALPKALGRALAVSGAGSGLTSRALGLTAGAETHTLTQAQLPALALTFEGVQIDLDPIGVTNGGAAVVVGGLQGLAAGSTVTTAALSVDIPPFTPSGAVKAAGATTLGSDSAHNNMQPSSFWNVMVKL